VKQMSFIQLANFSRAASFMESLQILGAPRASFLCICSQEVYWCDSFSVGHRSDCPTIDHCRSGLTMDFWYRSLAVAHCDLSKRGKSLLRSGDNGRVFILRVWNRRAVGWMYVVVEEKRKEGEAGGRIYHCGNRLLVWGTGWIKVGISKSTLAVVISSRDKGGRYPQCQD
jgi:hypothetical protein